MTEWELGILDKIQEWFGSGFGDTFFPAVTKLGDAGMIWIGIALVLFLIPSVRKTGIVVIFSLLLQAVVCNQILKPAAARIRPCDLASGISLLIPRPEDFSFPSGHTAAGFSVAAALLLCKSRLGIPALLLASVIAFSRLYLYVHFPSDVLAGAMLGTASALLVFRCGKRITKKRFDKALDYDKMSNGR